MRDARSTDSFSDSKPAATLAGFGVDASRGLSAGEVEVRRAQFGYNEITEREEPLWHRVGRRFWGPIPFMIEAAAVLSAVAAKWEDLAIILVMLATNAGLDFFQEGRALNALKALKQRLTNTVITLRDGQFSALPTRELVPGDIVRLRIGNIVPADAQLIDGAYLQLDESALTGESLPVDKRTGAVVYANTIVKQGEMLAVIVNTGAATNFHRVVALVARAQREERSHFQKMVVRIGHFLILITLVLVALIAMVSLFRHENLLEIVRFALVLTIAAIPVAMPAVLSVTMAVGAMNLARRQAVVSRLTAIEELAGMDVFCSDKTGTLTQNVMQVAEPFVVAGTDVRELMQVAALASRPENNDPIEVPIFRYIEEHVPDLDWKSWKQVDFVPFDPMRKRTEAHVERNGESFVALKGAPQVIVGMSALSDSDAQAVEARVDALAGRGYRTLGVGRRNSDTEPVRLLGLIPLYDPPREDSSDVIQRMVDAGVAVKMVTGDHLAIAKEIGRLLKLPQHAMRAAQLSGRAGGELMRLTETLASALYRRLKPDVSRHDADQFATEVMDTVKATYDTRILEREFTHTHAAAIVETVESVDIFAEVVPEDKFRIVDMLQQADHIVGMTGDGVNDAPALKRADCGIAVANATDAARAAADIVLTAPGLSVIHDAVDQARIIFERMKSYATYRIAETLRIILFMTLSILVFNFYPITPLMIILLALLNDVPILAISYDHVNPELRPVRWNLTELLTISSVLGTIGVLASFLLFFLLKEYGMPEELIRSCLFLKLIVAGHSTLYVTRARGWFWQRPWPSPLLFGATFGTEIVGTLIAVYGLFIAPIGWGWAVLVWAYSLAWFIAGGVARMATLRLLGANQGG
jgi:H+-transporting ATPase